VSDSAQKVFTSLKTRVEKGEFTAAPGGGGYGIHYRTLGNVGYFISSLNTSRRVIKSVEDRILEVLM
jgi:dethiobiotin synthetase/adenosylmethionine--8-amino-7-oxononanoate aminotransferase